MALDKPLLIESRFVVKGQKLDAQVLATALAVYVTDGTLDSTGVDPRRLVFEVTETLLLEDSERVTATLSQLRELGVRFALDDFGT